jgi:hypothetical protein
MIRVHNAKREVTKTEQDNLTLTLPCGHSMGKNFKVDFKSFLGLELSSRVQKKKWHLKGIVMEM